MGHDHGHDHTHGANKKVLLISFIIITLYMIVEAIGGFLTNSLALLADAGHMLSDAISLGIALLAFTFGARAANRSKTFGYKRFEILAAVLNGLTLIGIALFIFYEAIDRFANPPEVASTGMRSEERRVGKEYRAAGIRDGHVTGVQTCALPISYHLESHYWLLRLGQEQLTVVKHLGISDLRF